MGAEFPPLPGPLPENMYIDTRVSHERIKASLRQHTIETVGQHLSPKAAPFAARQDVLDMDYMRQPDAIFLTFGTLQPGALSLTMVIVYHPTHCITES